MVCEETNSNSAADECMLRPERLKSRGWRRQDGEKEPLSELQMLLKVAVLSLFLFSREKDVQKGKSNTSFVALDVPKISKK